VRVLAEDVVTHLDDVVGAIRMAVDSQKEERLENLLETGSGGAQKPHFLERFGVEPTRIELVTSSMPWMRSPS
jgi:hypothetical protein